jgi:hypothetical protein
VVSIALAGLVVGILAIAAIIAATRRNAKPPPRLNRYVDMVVRLMQRDPESWSLCGYAVTAAKHSSGIRVNEFGEIDKYEYQGADKAALKDALCGLESYYKKKNEREKLEQLQTAIMGEVDEP